MRMIKIVVCTNVIPRELQNLFNTFKLVSKVSKRGNVAMYPTIIKILLTVCHKTILELFMLLHCISYEEVSL